MCDDGSFGKVLPEAHTRFAPPAVVSNVLHLLCYIHSSKFEDKLDSPE